MNLERSKGPPAAVPRQKGAQQAGDIRDRWWWVEPWTWTERMLDRLEQSGPTTKWPNRWFAKQRLFSLEHGTCNYV
jgi:hypothetical protein